jgi:hypothetical protein
VVSVEESEGDLVQRSANRVDLGDDVDVVTVVLDHLDDTADLAFDLRKAFEESSFVAV